MFEIIPNWHPVFVHFTIALLSLAVGLFVVMPFVKSPLKEQWQTVAFWALWFGAGFTVITGLTGLYAYNTITHDTPSHVAMTDHRNWAIVTIVVFMVLAAWSIICVRKSAVPGAVFVIFMVIAGGFLASTAWHGGEVVYRYGLGVMSLPKIETEGHSHSSGEDHMHGIELSKSVEIGQHGHDDGAHPDEIKVEMDTRDMSTMMDGHSHEH